MTKFYYLAPLAVTMGTAKQKHPQSLNRRKIGRRARAARAPTIGPTPMFPQPPWKISMKPRPSFAKKKQRTTVLREIRKDPTSNALETAKRNLAEPEREDAVELSTPDNIDDFWSAASFTEVTLGSSSNTATVEMPSFSSHNPFCVLQLENDDKSVSTAYTVETVTTAATVTQTVDDDI